MSRIVLLLIRIYSFAFTFHLAFAGDPSVTAFNVNVIAYAYVLPCICMFGIIGKCVQRLSNVGLTAAHFTLPYLSLQATSPTS